MRHNTLTWPQNAGNPISEDLNFKNFSGADFPGPPTGDHLRRYVSRTPSLNSVSTPATLLWRRHIPHNSGPQLTCCIFPAKNISLLFVTTSVSQMRQLTGFVLPFQSITASKAVFFFQFGVDGGPR